MTEPTKANIKVFIWNLLIILSILSDNTIFVVEDLQNSSRTIKVIVETHEAKHKEVQEILT